MKRNILMTMCAPILLTTPSWAQLDINGMCVGDRNGDRSVTVDELVTAVNNSLGECPSRDIEISFAATVGGEDFECGATYPGQGSGDADLRLTDYRFYVSNIRLIDGEGNEVALELEQDGQWQQGSAALLDFEDACGGAGNEGMNSTVRGTAPAGVYSGVRFDFGLPFDMNHENAEQADPPLNVSGMFWNWNGGYKFIRVDGFAGPEGSAVNYNLHLGSTGCNGSSPLNPPTEECANPNRPEVTLMGFNPDQNVIVADVGRVLADADLEMNQAETAPGCQSQPFDGDCTTIFPKLGLPFGETPAEQQVLFSVE